MEGESQRHNVYELEGDGLFKIRGAAGAHSCGFNRAIDCARLSFSLSHAFSTLLDPRELDTFITRDVIECDVLDPTRFTSRTLRFETDVRESGTQCLAG